MANKKSEKSALLTCQQLFTQDAKLCSYSVCIIEEHHLKEFNK